MLGYRLDGTGDTKVFLLHNWLEDGSSYDWVIPYLNLQKATYARIDWRGYGRSKAFKGAYSVDEACQDAIEVADALGWREFYVVGHSMSGMIAQKMALEHRSRVLGVVAIAAVPASGAGKAPDLIQFLEEAACSNDENAKACLRLLTGDRLSDEVLTKMIEKWRACSTKEARLGYLHMFSSTDFSERVVGLDTPMLVLYSEFDAAGKEAESSIRDTFLKWYPKARMECCSGSGHFPTQETPLFLASCINRFIEEKDRR